MVFFHMNPNYLPRSLNCLLPIAGHNQMKRVVGLQIHDLSCQLPDTSLHFLVTNTGALLYPHGHEVNLLRGDCRSDGP
jgi:hypothetical protein